jgi:putative transposase
VPPTESRAAPGCNAQVGWQGFDPRSRANPQNRILPKRRNTAESRQSQAISRLTNYYRWRREFGGLKSDQVKRLKELEAENARLRKAIADLTLDKQILAEAARGNY